MESFLDRHEQQFYWTTFAIVLLYFFWHVRNVYWNEQQELLRQERRTEAGLTYYGLRGSATNSPIVNSMILVVLSFFAALIAAFFWRVYLWIIVVGVPVLMVLAAVTYVITIGLRSKTDRFIGGQDDE